MVVLLTIMPIRQVSAQSIDSPYGVTLESKEAESETAQSVQWIKTTGMGWVRLQEHWGKNLADNFALADKQIAMSSGLKIDWPIQAAPSEFIQPGCQQVFQAKPAAVYAVQVFKRYGGKISEFEIGNEEWSFEHVANCRTVQNYASVFTVVSQALRKAGYTAGIGTFGYTHYASTAGITNWWSTFAKLVTSESYGNFHFYHEGEDPNVAYPGKPSFMQVVNAIYGAIHKPVWVTEYGYNTNCNFMPGCNLVTPSTQAKYEHEILEDGRLSGGKLTHAFVYTLEPGTQRMSIYQNGQPLPAATMEAAEAKQYPIWR